MSEAVDELRETIEDYLDESNIPYTDRGPRLSVRHGSSAVFIKPGEWADGHTIVEMLAPVLSHIECTDGLLRKLNELNTTLYFGKAYWHDNAVWIAHNLLGDHVDRDELVAAVGIIVSVADKLDDELKNQFGGTRWIES